MVQERSGSTRSSRNCSQKVLVTGRLAMIGRPSLPSILLQAIKCSHACYYWRSRTLESPFRVSSVRLSKPGISVIHFPRLSPLIPPCLERAMYEFGDRAPRVDMSHKDLNPWMMPWPMHVERMHHETMQRLPYADQHPKNKRSV